MKTQNTCDTTIDTTFKCVNRKMDSLAGNFHDNLFLIHPSS